ncbi:hypothetical protein, partial [Acinetobacter stercoris]|uniref:hypothetical protein n=1 Tax=Acinetobacter stercoris TaxID=2126983 RepID=UPI00148D0349
FSSSLLFSACGGGDGGGESLQFDNKVEQWSYYEIFEDYNKETSKFDKVGIHKEITTINNNQLFFKSSNTTPYDFYHPVTYITNTGLYEDGKTDNQLGIFKGTISKQSNQWIIEPNSNNNSQGFKITKKFDLINIKGKSLLTILYPIDYVNVLNYMPNLTQDTDLRKLEEQLRNATFPEGSTCIQIKEISNNEENFQLEIAESIS